MTRGGFCFVSILGGLLVCGGNPAAAETVSTGVLSPDTVESICESGGAYFHDFGKKGYGCHSSRILISCSADLDCIAKVRGLDPYTGNTLDRFLFDHGMRMIDTDSPPAAAP